MKNLHRTITIFFIAFFSFHNVNGQKVDKKIKKAHKKEVVAAPYWYCNLVQINCDIDSPSGDKVVYVDSYAGHSVYTNEWVQIFDANNNLLHSFGPLTSQYTSPPFNISSGQTYTVKVVDGNGILHHENDGTPNSFSIVAPDCLPPVIDSTPPIINSTSIINTCCPPWNKTILSQCLIPNQPTINSPYTLIFSPSANIINQLTAYNNYLKVICPDKTLKIYFEVCKVNSPGSGSGNCNLEINADWINFTTPIVPSLPYTLGSWSLSPGQGSSLSKPKLQINQWYRIHTNIYQDPEPGCFDKECSSVDIWYRISYSDLRPSGTRKNQLIESILEISDGKKIIKTIKLKD